MTTDDPVLIHRVDYWTWLDLHAVAPMRGSLLRLRDHWHAINLQYFDGVMALPYITLTEPSKPSVYGQCCAVSSWGSRLEIKLRPSLLDGTHPHTRDPVEGRWRFVEDVLLHEAIHQYGMEITGRAEQSYHGRGPAFTERANRIGATLGLLSVVVKNRGGEKVAKAAQWPHCVRPVSHLPPVPSTRDTPHCPTCRCQDMGGDTVTDFVVTDRRQSHRPSATVVDLADHQHEARSAAAITLVAAINDARLEGRTQDEAQATVTAHPAMVALMADGVDQAIMTMLLLAAFLDLTRTVAPSAPEPIVEPNPEPETGMDQWTE